MEPQTIKKFLEFAESLKLVRNAEAEIDGKGILDEIYTDLLPNNGILNRVNLPRTTILVGRKGTGKSTIFQKSQKDIDGNKRFLSVYIDVKSLFENSSPTLPSGIQNKSDSQELIKYLIYANFIRELILQVKNKLKIRLEKNYIINVLGLSDVVLENVFERLNEIEENIDAVFQQLNMSLITSYQNTLDIKSSERSENAIKVNLKDGIHLEHVIEGNEESNFKKEFGNTLITYLDLKRCFISNIIQIRDILKIKNLFIYLDDFSEIDKYAQELFMDWFIAPVNNLSEDFVKFKIATYPKRFYYGKLDNAKIDEISLDFFDAYYSFEKKSDVIDITKMEQLALNYTERLIENRLKVYFPDNNWEKLFEIKPVEIYELLFNSSMNIARKMGYILTYCYESCLIHNTKISKTAIENSALRYYSEVVEKYFLVNEYICKPFEDKISNQHQYELIGQIVKRQISNKQLLTKRGLKGKDSDTGHFYISEDISYLLNNLELNGFITTYNKVKEANQINSTLYSLDLGLCKKHKLNYGRPNQIKSNNNVPSKIFNFNSLILDYFNTTQVIKCELGHEFPYSQIAEFQKFDMNCPTCMRERKLATCVVSKKFEDLKQRFLENEDSEDIKLSFQAYIILNLLKLSQTALSTNRISATLDMAKATVENQINTLLESGMVEYDLKASDVLNKDYVIITARGVRTHQNIDKILDRIVNNNNENDGVRV